MPAARSPQQSTGWLTSGPLLALSVGMVAAMLGHFFDRSWWPPDDGAYAHVADRILRGDRLNGEIQDIHAGYVNLFHALLLALFGEDMRALRYGLVALTLLQSALAFLLLLPAGRVPATVGAVALGALSFVQFPNPTANWYALFLAFATLAVLARWPRGAAGRDLAVGFLLGLAVCTRQLSGVFLGLGVIVWLLVEAPQAAVPRPRSRMLGRLLLVAVATIVAVYVWRRGGWAGAAMFGIWPVLLGAALWRWIRIDDSALLALLVRLAAGGLAALAPLLAYHLAAGTLASWFEDTVLAALHLSGLDFIGNASFAHVALLALGNLFAGAGPLAAINAVYWLTLLALPMVLGAVVVGGLLRGRTRAIAHPLPLVAIVYGLVSMHYEIPIYLCYSTGLTVVALIGLVDRPARIATLCMAAFLATVGLLCHAGQPLTRGYAGIVAGETRPLGAGEGLPRARIAMETADRELYARLVALVHRETGADDPILALPMSPEIYFLSERPPAVRFFNSGFGLRDAAAVAAALARLREAPPRLIVHRREDKYNTPTTVALLAGLRPAYVLAEQIGDYDVYRLRPPSASRD